jgi:hypothetical protein
MFLARTLFLLLVSASGLVYCQDAERTAPDPDPAASPATDPVNVAPVQDKRIFGVLPNYRTAEDVGTYVPLTPKQKFHIAFKDSFDWPGYLLGAAFAGLYQLENSNPSFGQGLEGYAKRYAAAYGDQVIGNFMTEGFFPTMLHEDPRYFRHPSGSKKSRLVYAATRIFVTRTDSGGKRFNFSEVLGNSTAVAISNLYYPDSRNVSDNVQKLGIQLATDSFSNVLKEFWPDIKRKMFKKSATPPSP